MPEQQALFNLGPGKEFDMHLIFLLSQFELGSLLFSPPFSPGGFADVQYRRTYMRLCDLSALSPLWTLIWWPFKIKLNSVICLPQATVMGWEAELDSIRWISITMLDVLDAAALAQSWRGREFYTNDRTLFLISKMCTRCSALARRCLQKCRELHDGKRINKPVTKVGKNPYCSATVKNPLPFYALLTLPKHIICVFIHSFVLLTSTWNKINSAARLAPWQLCMRFE